MTIGSSSNSAIPTRRSLRLDKAELPTLLWHRTASGFGTPSAAADFKFALMYETPWEIDLLSGYRTFVRRNGQ
jgi:hypothetical protein